MDFSAECGLRVSRNGAQFVGLKGGQEGIQGIVVRVGSGFLEVGVSMFFSIGDLELQLRFFWCTLI